MSGNDALTVYAARMRRLVEQDLEIAADLRELAKEMRDIGLQAAVLKAWVKAQIKADGGDDGSLVRLKERTQYAALYAEALGIPIEGFSERNRLLVNDLPPHDPETGEIQPAVGDPLPTQAVGEGAGSTAHGQPAPSADFDPVEDLPKFLRRT